MLLYLKTSKPSIKDSAILSRSYSFFNILALLEVCSLSPENVVSDNTQMSSNLSNAFVEDAASNDDIELDDDVRFFRDNDA